MKTLPPSSILNSLIKPIYPDYFNIKDRTRRDEYWTFTFLTDVIFLLLYLPIRIFNFGNEVKIANNQPIKYPFYIIFLYIIIMILSLGLIVPNVTITVRRLHDSGRTGKWAFLYLFIILGIIPFIFCLFDSDKESNKYGRSPKYVVSLNPEPIQPDENAINSKEK